jgi:hypothetical protein
MLVMVLVVSVVVVIGVMALQVGRSVKAMSRSLFFFERGSILMIGMHRAEGVKHRSGVSLIMMVTMCGSVVQFIAGPCLRCAVSDTL